MFKFLVDFYKKDKHLCFILLIVLGLFLGAGARYLEMRLKKATPTRGVRYESSCQAQFELIESKSSYFSARFMSRYTYPYDEKTAEWDVIVKSLDKNWTTSVSGPSLCPLLDGIWNKLNVYDSYVNENERN